MVGHQDGINLTYGARVFSAKNEIRMGDKGTHGVRLRGADLLSIEDRITSDADKLGIGLRVSGKSRAKVIGGKIRGFRTGVKCGGRGWRGVGEYRARDSSKKRPSSVEVFLVKTDISGNSSDISPGCGDNLGGAGAKQAVTKKIARQLKAAGMPAGVNLNVIQAATRRVQSVRDTAKEIDIPMSSP